MYYCTALDFATMDVVKRLKHCCGEARTEAMQLLGQVTPSQAASGHLEKDGEADGVETTGLRPDNNSPHEHPAPNVVSLTRRRMKT